MWGVGKQVGEAGHFQRDGNKAQVHSAQCSQGAMGQGWGHTQAGARRSLGTAHVQPYSRPALQSQVLLGSKTQHSRLSNSIFPSQMKTCPKTRPRFPPRSLQHLEGSAVGRGCITHSRFISLSSARVLLEAIIAGISFSWSHKNISPYLKLSPTSMSPEPQHTSSSF